MRTNDLNITNVDLTALYSEAQFYGLESLVKKISLCDENFSGHCGDLLFHAHIPSPDFSPNGVRVLSTWSRRRNCQDVCEETAHLSTPSSGAQRPGLTDSSFVVLRRRPRGEVPSGEVGNQSFTETPSTASSAPAAVPTNPLCHLKPVSYITCHQNLMAVVYLDCVGLFHLKEPLGWHLVWMSPCMADPIDRLALTCKATSLFVQFPSAATAVSSTSTSYPAPPPCPSSPVVNGNATNLGTGVAASRSYPAGAPFSNLPQSSPGLPTRSARVSGNPTAPTAPPNISGTAPSPVLPSALCLVAVATGSHISLWSVYLPVSNPPAPLVAMSMASVPMTSVSLPAYSPMLPLFCPSNQPSHSTAPLPIARESWLSDLIGRYDLNGRAVDHLFFIEAHLVALSRRGLVGVRHAMTNSWQVWSTGPILSHGVADSELLLLGSANGRICSINIQKFPLRIVDNDLLVTEMYRDPLLDPITALSVHLTSNFVSHPMRGSMEIAYGTLSGRVCLIVQYPENVGYSPQLLQTFTVHRSMVTRVVLSEKHLISVCNEFNHVRTWSISRFRGVISTQPGPVPFASFHVTALETGGSQRLVDSVVDAARRCFSHPAGSSTPGHPPMTGTGRPGPLLDPGNQFRAQSTSVPGRAGGPACGASATAGRQNHLFRCSLPSARHVSRPGVRSHSDRSSNAADSTRGGAEVAREPQDPPEVNQGATFPLAGSNSGQYNDIVVLPRTSWLHEAPSNASGRSSLATGQEGMFRFAPREPCSHPGGEQQTSPVVDLPRFANDPGPYGDRDDVLVFLQKLTPHANRLFLRLASNGRRVRVIKAIGDSPISSFTVHELDGCNRPGAYPRRYLFTGHPDGSIQVWDLTTALSQFKSAHSVLANAGGCCCLEDTGGGLGYGGGGGWTTASLGLNGASNLLPGHCYPTLAAVSPMCFDDCGVGGGPTSKELLHLLESCQLGTSTTSCYSLPRFLEDEPDQEEGLGGGDSSGSVTPNPVTCAALR